MNQSNIHLLDLPNEILLMILKKLDNADVLYSLFGINNERLDNLIQEDIFTNTLDFARASSITHNELDRFGTYILPRNHHCIKKLVLETLIMEYVLFAGDYPNLTSLELFAFDQEQISHFKDDSVFGHIFQYQITDLILHNDDEDRMNDRIRLDTYTKNVYAHIFALFKNIKRLTVVSSSTNEYPALSISHLPSTTCFSSTLTVLCINVFQFDDCLCLLDGRLKQLSTLIIQIHYSFNQSRFPCNKGVLENLKCFSLTCYNITFVYDELVVPLLCRMTHLEKLTLYLRSQNRSIFIDGTHLQNEILVHMPQLHTFIFYISTTISLPVSFVRQANDDIQRTFTHIKYGQTACIIEYDHGFYATCHVYSLPFTFIRLEKITNNFPNIVFNTVTHLSAYLTVAMQHEFLMRISHAFPMLRIFALKNEFKKTWLSDSLDLCENASYPVIEYSHLTSLDIAGASINCVAQYLLEQRTRLPRLTKLKVNYDQLKLATFNFTRDETRPNCSRVKELLLFNSPKVLPNEVLEYFFFCKSYSIKYDF